MGSHGGPGSSSGKTPAANNSSNPEASKKKSFLAVARSGLIGGSNHSTTAEVKPSGNASKEPSNKKQQGADGMSKKAGPAMRGPSNAATLLKTQLGIMITLIVLFSLRKCVEY